MLNLPEALHESYAKNRRIRVLAGHLIDLVPKGAHVLDVGTGDGAIARILQENRPDISIEGLEFQVREDCAIPCQAFDGEHLPHANGSVDYACFIDVLHHTQDPLPLLREAIRVARKGLLIKDHLKQGFLASPTLRFMDGVGNRRYHVNLPHNYFAPSQWQHIWADLGVSPVEWKESLDIYPWWANWVFGRKLHYFARLEKFTT